VDRSADLFRERILQIARLVLCGIDDDLPSAGEILIQSAAAHVLKLYHEEPRRCPFAAFVEADFSDDGLERVLVDVLCELIVVEAAGRGDRLFEHLHRGVGEGWLVETERVGSGAGRAFLVLLKEALDSRKTQLRAGHIKMIVDHPIELLGKLAHEGRILHPHHENTLAAPVAVSLVRSLSIRNRPAAQW